MKKLLFIVLIVVTAARMSAQTITDPFFDRVNYIGAFDGTTDWTAGWTNWTPETTDYPEATVTKGNGLFDITTSLHITANETWSGVVLLDGWVYVDEGATLTISKGTIIRATEKSGLIIQRGAKIIAVGTSAEPIVFTSNQGVDFRGNSDWAGVVICGKGINNLAGGTGVAEGGIGAAYGGNDNNDNSGFFKYVRIEFPGYEVATGSEVNGLTLYSVGAGTTIDYVQVSNSGDDGFEWFGGAVNAKHLISYRTEDDDFDTDNGFTGMVQYGLIARDSSIVDSDTANGFESDNDKDGSSASPKTNALFSNISAFGPSTTSSDPAVLRTNHNEGAAMRIRRNSRIQVLNSLFMGFGRGLRIESEKGWASAASDSLTVQYTTIAGVRNDWFKTDVAAGNSAIKDWFLESERKNDTITLAADVKITDPFNYEARNFQPMTGSPVLKASYWFYNPTSVTEVSINDPFFEHVNFIGAIGGKDWTMGWTNWTPEETEYPEATVTKGNGLFDITTSLHITANETWSGVVELDGWVYVDAGATLTVEAGTIIRATEKSGLIIQRGAKIMAEGTVEEPIVFTSSQGAGFRGNSDWAGLVICGKGINNLAGGNGVAEGGIGALYGGTNNEDNSGVLKYVRIEFPGYEVATGSEVNGLTLYSVGSGTMIDYVQVSNSGDDGFEWFGGAVNAKHLISYRTEDDDFDTDNGFIGMVQFGIIARDSSIVDSDTANGFESDNDKDGSSASPKTNALFSNISAFGPSANNTTPAVLRTNHNEGAGMRIRRNSRLQIYNSVFMGFGRGLRIESEKGWTAAESDSLTVQNTMLAGIRNDWFKTDVADGNSAVADWFLAGDRNNDTMTLASALNIYAPFNYDGRNFMPLPLSGTPVLTSSIWSDYVPVTPAFPVTFDPKDDAVWNVFANGTGLPSDFMVIPNPDKSGINTSNNVLQCVVNDNADPWAGAFSDYYGSVEFTESSNAISLMVWKSEISPVGFKVEGSTDGGPVKEVKVSNTVTNQWELLTFDFSACEGYSYPRIVFFPDFPATRTSGTTVYLDNFARASVSAVSKSNAGNVKVYPNPATDVVFVTLAQPGASVAIYNSLGKMIDSRLVEGNQTSFDVSKYSRGLYFVKVNDENVVKFIK